MNDQSSKTDPLHRMQPLDRFSNRARDYAKYRPTYPQRAISLILDGLGEPAQLTAADIGAGTGICSRLLGDRGLRVLALEPNDAMQAAAEFHPLVEFRQDTAEQTGLAPASVDLVVCCQSFHWFEPTSSLVEFHRILKPSGRLALMWNDRDPEDELIQGYSSLVRSVSNHHPAEQRLVAADPLFASPEFTGVRQYTLTHGQELDLDGLIGRALSVSYLPRQGATHEELLTSLKELHHRFCDPRGLIRLLYRTRLYLADPRQT